MEKILLAFKNFGIHKILLFIVAVGIIIFTGFNFLSPSQPEELVIPIELDTESLKTTDSHDSEVESSITEESVKTLVFAEIKGEVNHPGVYQLNEGDRVINLIEQAGGLTYMAATDAINQALVVTDQMSLIVPNLEEWEADAVINEETLVQNNEVQTTELTTVNINTADINSLQTLPGIGPKKAEAIILYREEQGSFQTAEEIMNISGIGTKTYEKLAPYIRVGD